jgi:ribosomal protein S18 acetylase RimI-like enzyme
MLQISHAESAADIAAARELFTEYAESLGFSLCFQGFDQELATLPGSYADPTGRLLLARIDGKLLGCVALRKLEDGVCEMKRLYVRPESRGHAIGWALVLSLLNEAPEMGYSRMRLDTVPGKMDSAISMYRALGFHTIPPYCANPVEGALFFERDLQDPAAVASLTAVRNAMQRLVKLNQKP